MDALHKLDKNGKAIIISNGSPLFNGDVNSGENMFRLSCLNKLECIIQLPSELFYNTGIPVYI
jgi:type I restriction enzyme M protein